MLLNVPKKKNEKSVIIVNTLLEQEIEKSMGMINAMKCALNTHSICFVIFWIIYNVIIFLLKKKIVCDNVVLRFGRKKKMLLCEV